MWERSFVAVSVLVGRTLEEALAALPGPPSVHVAELEAKLRDARKPVRAHALATVAHEIAIATSEVTLR